MTLAGPDKKPTVSANAAEGADAIEPQYRPGVVPSRRPKARRSVSALP
jgi:hypothetical protein